MDLKTKYAIVAVPFLIAGAVGFSLAYPAYNEYATKAATVEEKKTELADLDGKLVHRNKVATEKRELDSAIITLRASVPKRPDLELLNLDIEKMALDSGLEIIAFKEADKDMKKRAGVEEEPIGGSNISKGKDKLAEKVKTTVGAAGAAAAGAGAAVAGAAGAAGAAAAGKPGAPPAKASIPPDAGLLKSLMQVKLIGDYKSLMAFTHKLETYQRVVAISEIKSTIPKAVKDAKKASAELPDETEPTDEDPLGNPNQLNISLVLTAYYLP